ncbi:hypothetical protein PUN28_016950 [Cardiocondyla obscurior]|uniref:Cyclin C-terminal domain-containing protein n=1 Tax=Cardiocondyla obscurior TaxID=286306 RepID=A0AAW2ENY1_9HYME
MSEKNVLSDRRTVSDKKSVTLINKENMYEVVHSGKFFDSKTDGCKKKGLSLKAENYTTQTTSGSSTSTSIGKFPIYVDDEAASNRSRSRVRKNVCRKEIRAKQDSKTLANTNLLSTKTLEVQSNLDLRVVHRTRFSSSCQQASLDKMVQMNKLFPIRRAISESRNTSSWAQHDVRSGSRQIELVSNDVKKRTFSSIQMWKDKMRKLHTGTIPKYEVNKMQDKIKLRKSSDVESVDFQIEKSINVQNQAANKNVEKLKSQNCLLNTVRAMPFEFMEIKKGSSTISDNFNAVTPSSSLVSPMTPTKYIYYKIITVLVFIIVYINTIFGNVVKVHHEKCSTMEKPLHQKNINSFKKTDVNDYLDFVLNIEREREKNIPRLSTCFLRYNVNAEQRRLIVGYMIRLGVKKALSQYEKQILAVVNFQILFANPFSILSYYIWTLNIDCACNIIKPDDIPRIYYCGSYMIDLSMLDESLCEIPTYVIATAAMEISLCLVYLDNDNVDEVFIQTFRSKLLLTVLEERAINSTRKIMMKQSLEREKFYSKVIYKKYLRSEYDKVSDLIYA